MPAAARQLITAVKAVVVLTVILGIAYPMVVLGIGRIAAPAQAGGSLVDEGGRVVEELSVFGDEQEEESVYESEELSVVVLCGQLS